MTMWFFQVWLLSVLVGVLTACSTVPVTGRSQLSLIPQSQVVAMGLQHYAEIMQHVDPGTTGSDDANRVRRIGIRIQHAVEQYLSGEGHSDAIRGYAWEFNLIDSPEPNAFCLPGGKVGVNAGILPIAGDDTGLAVVMGHEVAHAIANHGRERMSQVLLVSLGGMALEEALREKPEETRMLWLAAAGLGVQFGVLMPYSRMHESEADHLGLVFMAMAGYDPREAPAFWQRMANQGGNKPPEWLSTHPSDQTRIARLKEQIPNALLFYEAYP